MMQPELYCKIVKHQAMIMSMPVLSMYSYLYIFWNIIIMIIDYHSKKMEIEATGIVNRYIAAQGPLPHTCVDFWRVRCFWCFKFCINQKIYFLNRSFGNKCVLQ